MTKQDPVPRQTLREQLVAEDALEAVALPIPVMLKLSEEGLDVNALQADLNAIPAEELLKPLVRPEPP